MKTGTPRGSAAAPAAPAATAFAATGGNAAGLTSDTGTVPAMGGV